LTLFVLPVLYLVFEKTNLKKKKMNSGIVVSILITMLCIVAVTSNAQQQKITLQAAIDTALKNNLSVKNEKLKATYQQMLVATATNIAPASIVAEYGQINSFYSDSKLSISQQFSLPVVYKKHKALFEQEAKNSFLNIAVKETILKKQVEQSFYHLVYLKSKLQLLSYIDTLYSSFQKKAALRLQAGESNLLEKTTADNQLGLIKTQLDEASADIIIAQLQFKLLLNSNTEFVADTKYNKIDLIVSKDTQNISNHPVLQQIQQLQQIAEAAVKVEQSKLLPDVIVGINNTSIKGTGADDKVYSGGYRFTSVQAGVAIPIFSKTQKGKVEAAKFNTKIVANNYQVESQSFQSEYQAALLRYKKYQQTVSYFEDNSLKTALQITTTANQQFTSGTINYLEWVQLMNHSINTQNDYIEAVRNLNESIIQIHFFTSK
jgi:cobalt-zinc-cadmium resistance protein CzcA